MITRISLKNWKSHLDSELAFTPGVNGIVGIMGSGKTSIVQALTFALFGTFPALQSRRIGLDDLIMKKPQRKKSAEVCLEFEVGGKKYSVTRTVELGKGTTRAEVREDGRILEVNPQGVNRVVQDLLQMDYDLFSKAVYSEQNRLDYFLSVPRGHRMQHIDRMLKLDRFEKVRENSVSLANRISQGREEKDKILLEMEKENLGERIRKLSEELKGLLSRKRDMEKETKRAAEAKEEASGRVSEFDGMEQKLNSMNVEIGSVRTGLKEIEGNLEATREKLRGTDPEEIPRRLDKLGKEIDALEEELEGVRKRTEGKRNEIASLNAAIGSIKEEVAGMERLGDRCPVCDSRITEEKRRRLVDVRKGKEIVLRNKVNGLAGSMEDMKKHAKLLEDQIRERVMNRERLGSLVGDLDFIRDMEIRIKEHKERESELSREIGKLKGKIGCMDMKALREELQEAVARERELAAELAATGERISDREDALQELKEREGMLKRYRESARKDEALAGKLNSFVGVLKTTQDQLRQEFMGNVNRSMGMIWKELYPYGDFSDVRLAVDRDYVLQLKGTEGWLSVEGIASGGERSLACLALRVAFSMALVPNLKWLILDEPTHNLDTNAIGQFSSVLREGINRFVEQVFLITHEERVSGGVTGSLYRLERNKDLNEATRIAGV